MKQTELIMGMPITVEILDEHANESAFKKIFNYSTEVDRIFSPYKEGSEVSKINSGELSVQEYSPQMREVFRLAEQTKQQTSGYFDVRRPDGKIDPSGIVKGWAILNAAQLLKQDGYENFFVDAGGDIQSARPEHLEPWHLGIRNPFNTAEIVKVLRIRNEGVATSGTYKRGMHIYNPHDPMQILDDVVSITVIGPNVYEADRFATAAFAMGRQGINFIESLPGFEAYQIDRMGVAIQTSGFNKYIQNDA